MSQNHQVALRSIKWIPMGLYGYPLPNDDMNAIFIAKSPRFRQFPQIIKGISKP